MAITHDVYNVHLLNQWRIRNFNNVWHFNQVLGQATPSLNTSDTTRRKVWIQPERDQVARALYAATHLVHEGLRFAPLPLWHRQIIPLAYAADPEGMVIQLASGYLQAIGRRSATLIAAGAAFTHADTDGDGVKDTATATVTTAVSLDEVAVFYTTAQGAPGAADERYRIEPINVSDNGDGTYDVAIHRARMIDLDQFILDPYKGANLIERNYADSTDDTDFETVADVYQISADSTDAVEVGYIDSGGNLAYVSASASIMDATRGMIRVHSVPTFTGQAVHLRLWYQAGYDLDAQGMPDRTLADAVVRIANTHIWRDLATVPQGSMSYLEDMEQMRDRPISDFPFGDQLGQVKAWETVKARRLDCPNLSPGGEWEYV